MTNNNDINLDATISILLENITEKGGDLDKIISLYNANYGSDKKREFIAYLKSYNEYIEPSKKSEDNDNIRISRALSELFKNERDIGSYLSQYNGNKLDFLSTLNSALNFLKSDSNKKLK